MLRAKIEAVVALLLAAVAIPVGVFVPAGWGLTVAVGTYIGTLFGLWLSTVVVEQRLSEVTPRQAMFALVATATLGYGIAIRERLFLEALPLMLFALACYFVAKRANMGD